jgi:hypothetical protein
MAYYLDMHDFPHFQHSVPPFLHRYTAIFPSFCTIKPNITVVVSFPRQPLQKDVKRLGCIPISGYTCVEENFLFYFLQQTYDILSYWFPSKQLQYRSGYRTLLRYEQVPVTSSADHRRIKN